MNNPVIGLRLPHLILKEQKSFTLKYLKKTFY